MNQPVCDLVLCSWNHLEETKPCLESLLEATRVPSRLFIVDNGSEPDVRAFLAAVQPRGAIKEIVVIQNEMNEGFPRAMNRGLKASAAPFVVILNNDLRFTVGWLQEMIEVATANPHLGVINPASNTLGNVPSKGVSLQAHADRLRQSRAGQYTEVGMCIGFCMLVKRELFEKIGGFNEQVERIFFEDEDFCMRAAQAGSLCVVAEGAYVYHAEHQTVRKMPEREALFARNREWCRAQWGRRLRLAWPRFSPLVPGSPELKQWLEEMIAWARHRTYVYAYCPIPSGVTTRAIFESVGLIPHADIHWRAIPARLAPAAAAVWILRRSKKRFDMIAAPSRGWSRLMQAAHWWHRAAVIPAEDPAQLKTAWKTKSRSPWSF
ncbi:MAG: glycosyltransferase family 2 protein [Candidatus Omnitrophica bacterium]|nr:glycosyltransferase family 2 protein [Candidatus Omnitrophota bacterium]